MTLSAALEVYGKFELAGNSEEVHTVYFVHSGGYELDLNYRKLCENRMGFPTICHVGKDLPQLHLEDGIRKSKLHIGQLC